MIHHQVDLVELEKQQDFSQVSRSRLLHFEGFNLQFMLASPNLVGFLKSAARSVPGQHFDHFEPSLRFG